MLGNLWQLQQAKFRRQTRKINRHHLSPACPWIPPDTNTASLFILTLLQYLRQQQPRQLPRDSEWYVWGELVSRGNNAPSGLVRDGRSQHHSQPACSRKTGRVARGEPARRRWFISRARTGLAGYASGYGGRACRVGRQGGCCCVGTVRTRRSPTPFLIQNRCCEEANGDARDLKGTSWD